MREFKGKTAFITGGASGIGFAMAKAFAEEGMNVMLADVEQSALDFALKGFRRCNSAALGHRAGDPCDHCPCHRKACGCKRRLRDHNGPAQTTRTV
jgi:NAD(P)-dependent dehydrogenase (short-subunit alcohol dehydrogenase family)